MASRAVPAPLAQLPNVLTVARFALIPALVVLVLQADGAGSWAAGAVLAAAGITDQVDGWLARRWRVESSFGKYADPLADRLMIDATVVVLVVEGRLPWIALALILARDVLLIGGYRAVMHRGYEFSVSALGKVATWILYAALAATLVTDEGTAWPLWLFWAGLALALVAALGYLAAASRTLRRT